MMYKGKHIPIGLKKPTDERAYNQDSCYGFGVEDCPKWEGWSVSCRECIAHTPNRELCKEYFNSKEYLANSL